MGKVLVPCGLSLVVMEAMCVCMVWVTAQRLGVRCRFCPVSEPSLATVWRALSSIFRGWGVEL